MANICSNYILIKGANSDIENFLKTLEDNYIEDGRLNMDAFKDIEKHDYSPRWFFITNIENDSELLTISADSAWVPALSEFKYLSSMFPTLSFEYSYDERGYDVGGYAVIKNGEMHHDDLGYWGEILRQNEDFFMYCLEDEVQSMLSYTDNIQLDDFGSAKDCISEEGFQNLVNELKAKKGVN